MIERRKNNPRNSHRTLVHGSGFMDSLRSVGSYIYQNKDLLAKPMLSAVGNIGALALEEGSKAIINKIAKNKQAQLNARSAKSQLSTSSAQILENIMNEEIPATNIIGSGIKRF